jgi:hypothetical protein
VDNSSGLGVTPRQDLIKLLLGQLAAGIFAQRINPNLAKVLAPVLDNLAEGALACSIAEEAFI